VPRAFLVGEKNRQSIDEAAGGVALLLEQRWLQECIQDTTKSEAITNLEISQMKKNMVKCHCFQGLQRSAL